MHTYDVVIIGAGSGGLPARREVVKITDNYIVCDPGTLGTTCARVGCMPSKVLIQIADDFHRRHSWEEEGILGEGNLHIDSKLVMKHVRKLRDRFVRATMGGMESWMGDKLVRKKASFIDKDTLLIGEDKVKFKKVIIATGTTPIIPSVFQGYENYIVTTNEFFELEELPKSMAVIGTGVIGMELGQSLAKLDIDTVIIGRSKNICHISDPELNEYVLGRMEAKLNMNFSGVTGVSEENGKLKLTLGDGTTKLVSKVLMAAGRSPNLDKVDFQNTGVSVGENGIPEFDPTTMRIKGTNYYIAGDVNKQKELLHEASDEGRVAGFNSVRDEDQAFKFRTPLVIAFTDPNIAFIGKTYKELKDSNTDFVEGKVLFEGQGRSIIKLKEEGMLKVYANKTDGLLLGAELYAPAGEHLAHLISWAIESELTLERLLSYPFYHPVIEEGLRTSLRNALNLLDCDKNDLEIYKIN